LPKTITLTIDYLRSGKPKDTFVTARVVKAGRRVTTLHVTAFQEDEQQPIATAIVVLKVG
jgi:acyl-coenzyme A thioesterase PaaI-like protein